MILHSTLRVQKQRKLKSLTNEQLNLGFRKTITNNRRCNVKPFAHPLINLSSSTLTRSETDCLSSGSKFAILPVDKKTSLRSIVLITDIATEIQNDSRLNSEFFKTLVNDMINHVQLLWSDNLHSYFSIRKKIADKKLSLLRADKGECLILMDTEDYITKVIEFLAAANARVINYNINTYVQL